jgi:hypothetical protein
MKEYHPSMTGLESHMEEELAKQGKKPDEAVEIAQQLITEERRSEESPETEMDHRTEEAMHLDL